MSGCFRWLWDWRLWPRGRLDIGGRDLLFACLAPWLPGAAPRRVWPTAPPHLVALSVRTAWDALLTVQGWPAGSEIIVSEANIPDMMHLIEVHDLVPVAAPLNPGTLSLEVAEVQARITARTRAILVSPLFGSRLDFSELGALAAEHGLLLVEDNAQAYSGPEYVGSPAADASFFSFGLIKTRTALGGAVVFARDARVLKALESQLATSPVVSTREFYAKWLRAVFLHLVGHPAAFRLFWRILERKGLNPDVWLSQATRGIGNRPLLPALRRQPHRATRKLLRRRLSTDSSDSRRGRIERGRAAQRVLAGALGRDAEDSVFWALPVEVADRESLVVRARAAGFDVSFRTSSLACHGAEATAFSRALERVVYLPVGVEMPLGEWQRLLQIVRDEEGEIHLQ